MNTLKTWSLPPNYIGAHWDGYLVAPVQINRDSDLLTQSNWEVQWAALKPLVADCAEDECSPTIVRENHWAVGWVEWVAIHPSNVAAVAAAEALAERLEQYPVLDEMDLSNREADAYAENWASGMGRDFIRALQKDFSTYGWTLSDRLTDLLGEHLDALRELYERLTPSGDYWEANGWTSRLDNAADRCSREDVAQLVRSLRSEKVTA